MIRSLLFIALAAVVLARPNEYRNLPDHQIFNDYSSPLPYEYLQNEAIPENWDWDNVNGTSMLTPVLNQHIPQYCGSCWAHGALSALGDRIKIARRASGHDIQLSIQYILNCGTQVAGSCHGGSASGVYEFVKKRGFVPFNTCLQYAACSAESSEGNCKSADYTCSAINTCRTCSTFSSSGGKCMAVTAFPNATIAEYGTISGEDKIMKELFARGPLACGINADGIDNYKGGILDTKERGFINHIVSITGYGVDKVTGKKYWIVRNSWGETWGELGFFRIVRGENQLNIEDDCSWATPKTWSESNVPCGEDGRCPAAAGEYVDPAFVPMWHML